jgi:TBC1 domain family member 8/9
MNFLAAIFLLFMSEEEAFFLLAAVIERFLPQYYTPGFCGSLCDQRVLEEITEDLLPDVITHITDIGIPSLAVFTLPWILTLFVNKV